MKETSDMYKSGSHAKRIISAQRDNGSWGFGFHTLYVPYKDITTEQALRRLEILGFGENDECIKKALDYLNKCLTGELTIPDRAEVGSRWDNFVKLMLSTWICRFSNKYAAANAVADSWASVISAAFSDGVYDNDAYMTAYTNMFGFTPKGGRHTNFVNFYPVSITHGRLAPTTENAVVNYILHHEGGIYYTYGKPIDKTPEVFRSKEASRYIGAIELLSGFKYSIHKLSFDVEWLQANRNTDGKWDMSAAAKDNVFFQCQTAGIKPQEKQTVHTG